MMIRFFCLCLTALLSIVVSAITVHAADSAALPKEVSTSRIFTYELRMSDVDSTDHGRPYDANTPTGRLIGFKSGFTASKHMPYTIGPGRVRAYLQVFPEGRDRRISVTIGSQTQSIVLKPTTQRYHQPELVFDLPQATSELQFKAESVDGQPQRIIWDRILLTNDPDLCYTKVGAEKFKLIRRPAVIVNSPGNLLPNSGFEEGIENWDVTAYKSNIMVKPMLLSSRAAHGGHSLDVGKIPVTTRWFRLAGKKHYTLSLYVAQDNPVPVTVRMESSAPGESPKLMLTAQSTDATTSSIPGWSRLVVPFVSGDDNLNNGGEHRLILSADGSDKAVLVDSVQITEGDQPLPYSPHMGVEAQFISPTTQAIFELGKSSDIYFNLVADEKAKLAQVSYQVTDYFDRIVQPETELALSSVKRSPVSFSTDRAGLFRIRTKIEYTWSGQSRTIFRDFFYNVVHPAQPRKDRLAWSLLGGYFTAAPNGPFSYLELTQHFGIFEFNTLGHPMGRWTANLKRDAGDPKKVVRGQYDFSNADQQWTRFREQDINTIVNFHVKPTGGYGVAFGLDSKEENHVIFRDKRTFSAAEWLDFVKAFTTHFKGRSMRYVVQDEPYSSFETGPYVAFYRATRSVIKQADPQAKVFIHGGFDAMPTIKELDRLTGGKAHEEVDGIYLYLTQTHSGPVSRAAAPAFRQWVREHKIPVMTPTCFSGGASYSGHAIKGAPDYLIERAQEFRSIQHLFDGLIWGESQCFYYYYGSHPSGGYASLFDKFGQVIPMVHFYSAANAMVGDVVSSESIDDFDALRIGVIQTARGKNVAVMYSVDGNLYQLDVKGTVIDGAFDSFGNPAQLRRDAGGVKCVVGPHPQYFSINNADKAAAVLRQAKVAPKIAVQWAVDSSPVTTPTQRAVLTCDEPLEAWTLVQDLYRPEQTSMIRATQVSPGKYEIRLPAPPMKSGAAAGPRSFRLSTNLGDLYLSPGSVVSSNVETDSDELIAAP